MAGGSSARTQGFTLLELLVVIAILMLIAGLLGFSLLRSIRGAELRDAATLVAADLRRAKSVAQRGSRDVTMTWTPDSQGRFTQYNVSGKASTLPAGTYMVCSRGCSTTEHQLTYTAPHGELSRLAGAVQGKAFTLGSLTDGVAPLSVRVVGVTGKVVIGKGITP